MSKFYSLIFCSRKIFILKTKHSALENLFLFTNFPKKMFISIKLFSSSSLLSCQELNLTSDSEQIKNLKVWIEYCRYDGYPIPEIINKKQINHLLTMPHEQKLKYLNYLFVTEKKKKENAAIKVKLKDELEQKKVRDLTQAHHIKYAPLKNSIFPLVSSRVMKDVYYHQLASAMMYNQPLILDLSFGSHMKVEESRLLAKHIRQAIVCNRENITPFNLTLCNTDFNTETMTQLKQFMPNINEIPMNIFTKSYLDLYPKEKLVYLSPDAKEEMKSFDHEAIYIIGGVFNTYGQPPLSLSKAKREQIKAQKLPLDRYHVFKYRKTLTVLGVVSILLDLQNTGDWKTALENIPAPHIKTATERHVVWYEKKQMAREQRQRNVDLD